ncbi:AMP-binding protein [Aestuariicella hydrocarbonica]|uniref:AMP-binding protein n=1 Tax=Pseudomaricurvus hydrocarbonicus TaxID=1470433 RepID=A0A9E5JVC0_9GAMM|nr:AMP-binding protein [Aestuariicella hydrocarbonica]NHO66136.1 AMP-binding protein [Aestuariicella hydrocarbonica]
MNWNFGDLLDMTAANVPPERPALIQGDKVITWDEFDTRTNRLARSMLAAGLKTGSRVAIMARNTPEFIEIAAAAFKARLTHVNINYRYTTAEIAHVLADCSASGLFYQAEFADTVETLFDELSDLSFGVKIGGVNDTYEELVSRGDGSPLNIQRSPDDGYLLYTGGTTGKPKGVMWRSADARKVQLEAPTIKHIATNLEEHGEFVAKNSHPGRCIPACPLMHGAGLNSAMAELLGGGTAILLPSVRFSAEELWDEVERTQATRVLIVGDAFARPMVQALKDHSGRWNLSSLKVMSSAGLMWSSEIKHALIEAMPQVTLIDILGASEASGFGYAITTVDHATPTGFFEPGKNTVLIEVETDRVLAEDEVGKGWLARREPFAAGYYGDPEKTASVYRSIDGVKYAIPGDMAARNSDGRIQLLGRDNMCINTGGEKVFVEEVEESLKRAPGIVDAMVVGVPDDKWGSKVVALVQVNEKFDEKTVNLRVSEDLAAYKLPKAIVLLESVPRHASGKGDYRLAKLIAENH